MTERTDEQFSKRVQWKDADAERQIATGVVMVPDKVDLQGDYVREGTIRDFAEDFMQRLSAGETAEGGVMHAVWPEEHTALVENNVLDQAREIGGKEYPSGTWTQSWQFDDPELWSLVEDDILSGYSIGATDVAWSEGMDQEDLPGDVDVAADYPEDQPAFELQDGTVHEVSAVDIPAVPDAEILATKDAEEKRLSEHLGDREAFIDEAMERGHNEEAASRLWNYLQRASEEGATELEADAPSGVLQRVGKAALNALPGSDDDTKTGESEALDGEKEGRTLSRSNRDALFASIDASLDVLEDAGVDHGMTRFTDRDDIAFTLDDHTASEWSTDEDEDGEETPAVLESAPGGDTPDDDKSMSDDPMEDAPEWAKALHDDIEENSKQIEELTSDDGGKSADGEGDDPEKGAFEDAPEWAKALKQETEKNAQRIDDVAKASGTSQQLEAGGQSTNPNRKTSEKWDQTLGLPQGGDA